MLGAEQAATGPALSSLDVPEDAAQLMRLHTELDIFGANAPLIVAGFRDGQAAAGASGDPG